MIVPNTFSKTGAISKYTANMLDELHSSY